VRHSHYTNYNDAEEFSDAAECSTPGVREGKPLNMATVQRAKSATAMAEKKKPTRLKRSHVGWLCT